MSLDGHFKVGSPVCIKEVRSLHSPNNFLTPKKSVQSKGIDRFIPSNVQSNLYQLFYKDECFNSLESTANTNFGTESGNEEASVFSENKNYSKLLKANAIEMKFDSPSKLQFDYSPQKIVKPKILSFSTPKKENKENSINSYHPFTDNKQISPKSTRNIPESPYKVLDAPGLLKDFYLNLIDWSSADLIAVGLGNNAYAWSSSKLMNVCELEDSEYICSVSWAANGSSLSVGSSNGEIKLFDVSRDTCIREFKSHVGRVCNLKWSGNLLASAGRDGIIAIHDYRTSSRIMEFEGHEQEICGLQWSPDELHLASGANDNNVKVWNMKTGNCLANFTNHTAAVKALAWSPYKNNILVSGGGTSDKFIRFWDLNTLSQTKAINTGSQVCNLQFSKFDNEIISTHGYNSNQVILWDAHTMKKIVSLQGHTERIFYCASSPSGRDIVTGAGDETLRFWNIFSENVKRKVFTSKCTPSSFDLR